MDQTRAAGFKPLYEHIGEGMAINAKGYCDHGFLFPSIDKTTCILPQRVDIGLLLNVFSTIIYSYFSLSGLHYIMTGGLEGLKERYSDLIDRVSSFGRYTFFKDIDQYPAVKKLFSSESFLKSAEKVCPSQKSADGTVKPAYLDPFQFNFIIQVPGQTGEVIICNRWILPTTMSKYQ